MGSFIINAGLAAPSKFHLDDASISLLPHNTGIIALLKHNYSDLPRSKL
jgi:hypothetical protein